MCVFSVSHVMALLLFVTLATSASVHSGADLNSRIAHQETNAKKRHSTLQRSLVHSLSRSMKAECPLGACMSDSDFSPLHMCLRMTVKSP